MIMPKELESHLKLARAIMAGFSGRKAQVPLCASDRVAGSMVSGGRGEKNTNQNALLTTTMQVSSVRSSSLFLFSNVSHYLFRQNRL
ncbi:MAG: hypothetical protein AAGG11_13295 [Pseudomonadota bacterium]